MIEKKIFVICVNQVASEQPKQVAFSEEPGFHYDSEHIAEKEIPSNLSQSLERLRKLGNKMVFISQKSLSDFHKKEIALISGHFDDILAGETNLNTIKFSPIVKKVFISDSPEFLANRVKEGLTVGIINLDANCSDFSSVGVNEYVPGLDNLPGYLNMH